MPLYLVIAAGLVCFAYRALASGETAPRTSRRRPRGLPRADEPPLLTWLYRALAATLVVYAIQTAYSADVSNAIENAAFFLVPFAVMFVLLTEVRWTPRLLGGVLVAVAASGLVLAGVAFWEYAARDLLLSRGNLLQSNQLHLYFRVNSVFYDPNVFGRYLALGLVALGAYLAWARGTRGPLSSPLSSPVSCWRALALSYSITSFAALVAGLLVVVALRWSLRGALAGGLAILVCGAVFLLVSGTGETDLGSAKDFDTTTSGRVDLVRGGLELAEDRPVWGWGSGSFGAAFSRHIERARTTVSHSEPITVAAEQGAIGLVVYVALVVLALVVLLSGAGGSAGTAAAAACFVAMLVHSLSYASFAVDPATWALLGLGVALRRPRAVTSAIPAAAGDRGAILPATGDPPRPSRHGLVRLEWGPLVFEYLRRLATTGAAYTASSVLSKLIAVFLLPIYTRYLTPSDYGAAEVMLASVIAASIVVRLGVIEAILRFYYLAGERPERVVSTGFASLFWGATAAAAIALPFAGPISQALLDREDAGLARLAILGLWTLTLYEYALTLLRLDERARAYFGITVANVLVTIPFTVWLIVVQDERASGILLGTFATGAAFTVGMLWRQRRRLSLVPDLALLRRMFRFGLPTMPAELSLYSLNFIDRIILVRLVGLAEAGLYALAVKFAQGINVLARGIQLAWPPLAYSIQDDEEARRAYSVIFTWFAVVLAFGVTGLWLESRWIVRLLAAPEFFGSHRAVGLLATGIALYALYLAMVVILGRTGRTEFSFPATIAAHGDQRDPEPGPGAAAGDRRGGGWRWSPRTWWSWR